MTQRDKILSNLANDSELDKIIMNICKDRNLYLEAKQELFLFLCKLPQEKLFHLHNKRILKYFAIRTIKNFNKTNDQFNKEFVKFNQNNVAHGNDYILDNLEDFFGIFYSNDEGNTTLDILRQKIKLLPEFDKRMINQYIELKSCEAIAKLLKVSPGTVYASVKRIKNKLKQEVEQELTTSFFTVDEISTSKVGKAKSYNNIEEETDHTRYYIPRDTDETIHQFDHENYNGPVKHYNGNYLN